MPSDIFIKTASGWATGLAKKIFIKTASSTWSAAKSVFLFFDAGWTKVWPLSGVYATSNPFISTTSSSSELSSSTVLRVGTTYRGNRGSWNPNGYTISSYQYKWLSYTYEDPGDKSTNYDPAMSTLSGTTNDFLITGTNYDKGWIVFFVTAKASGGTAYDGSAESLRYYVARQKPIISSGPTLSSTTPNVGTVITYSSGWNTTDAYKIETNRSTIKWYRSTSSSLTESQLKSLTPIQSSGYSYTVVQADNANYIYAMEEVFNSGTDLESLVNGVTAVVQTTSLVTQAPNAFTYSLTNTGSVQTPSAPVQQRVSTTSNNVLIEMASAFPSDTESYELWSYGTGSSAGGTLANPAVQAITTLNQWNSSGNFLGAGSSFETVVGISSSASNSPISTQTRAIGTLRTLQFNISSTTGAQSWKVNYTISGASSGNGTFALNTNSMPASITIGGASNPTVTITGVTAYSGLNQTGGTTAGTAGSQTSLASVTKPSAFSTTSTANYTFYVNNQLTGSQRRVTLPSAFTSGTNIYVSTNGYINWGGNDPAGLRSIPTSGITLAPLAGDLRQGAVSASGTISTGGLWTFANSTSYWVTYWGNYYNDAAQVARYQVQFYWGQSYADVYIVNNSLTTITPSTTAVQNGVNATQDWSATTAQTSTLLSTASMNRISTQDGVDDNRTLINAVQPVAPSGGSAYMGNSSGSAISSINNGGVIYLWRTNATGSPAPSSSWVWQRNDGAGGAYVTRQTGGDTYTTSAVDAGFRIQAVVTWSNGVSPNQVYTTPTTVLVGQAQYTVTWDAATNGGTGGGTTTQNAGLSHTAPSASKASYTISYSSTGQTSGSVPSATQAFFTNTGYYDYPASNTNQTGPIAIGGSFTPSSSITMYMRYGSASQSATISNQGTLLRTGFTFGGWNIGGTVYTAGASYTPTTNVTATAVWNQNAVAPSNSAQPTLSGSLPVGSTLTFGVGTWSGTTPITYDLRLYRGTAGVLTSETLVAAPGNVTSSTYTTTQADFNSGQRYFRAYARATNSAGSSPSSTTWLGGQEIGPITTGVAAPVNTAAPSVTPSSGAAGTTFNTTNGSWSNSPTSYAYLWQYQEGANWITTGQTSSSFSSTSWSNFVIRCRVTATNSAGSTAAFSNSVSVTSAAVSAPGVPTSVTLSGSGAVTWGASTGSPTSYEIEFFTASNGSGANAAPLTATGYTVTGISASPYQLVSPYGGTNANYARVRVRARNSGGASSYSAWVPTATTYT
jgi:hypothetical protein